MSMAMSASTAGIGGLPAIAQRMAHYGRNGDTFLGHLEKDDTVIPMAVLDANPGLKDSLFEHMRSMGVDPQRYIVGTDFNSINPDTGLPEFFLKDLFRGIKDAAKAVVPLVLPFVVNSVFPNLGPVLSGAVGAGLGTVVSGGSGRDALKAAAVGGVAGGLFNGLRQGFQGTEGTFGSRVIEGTAQPFRDLGASIERTVQSPFTAVPAAGAAPAGKPAMTYGNDAQDATGARTPPSGPAAPAGAPPSGGTSYFEKAVDFFSPKSAPTLEATLRSMGVNPAEASPAQLALAQERVKQETPSFLRNYGPLMALGGIGAYALGAFDQPKTQAPVDFFGGQTGKSLLEANPNKYRLGPYVRPGVPPIPSPQVPGLAHGGTPFPRRTGSIAGPGTGTSDSIPAMLSDGEFVMTARAVRGAGDGSREKGMKTMYQMMRKFERNA